MPVLLRRQSAKNRGGLGRSSDSRQRWDVGIMKEKMTWSLGHGVSLNVYFKERCEIFTSRQMAYIINANLSTNKKEGINDVPCHVW